MQISLEPRTKHAILAYDNAQVTIDHIKYEQSIIVSPDIIIPWSITSLSQLTPETIKPMIDLNPEIIIIGHQDTGVYIPIDILQTLSKLRIGVECMNLGSASRTFNILLSEQRVIVAGLIFPAN